MPDEVRPSEPGPGNSGTRGWKYDRLPPGLEPLSPAILPEFLRLSKGYFQELDLVPEFHGLDQDLTAPLTAYHAPRGGLWLAWEPDLGQAVGMVGVLPIAVRSCELKRLYVAPEHRRRGLGRCLLAYALDFARRAGHLELLVALRHDQHSARALAESFGFKACARFNQNRQVGIFLSYAFQDRA